MKSTIFFFVLVLSVLGVSAVPPGLSEHLLDSEAVTLLQESKVKGDHMSRGDVSQKDAVQSAPSSQAPAAAPKASSQVNGLANAAPAPAAPAAAPAAPAAAAAAAAAAAPMKQAQDVLHPAMSHESAIAEFRRFFDQTQNMMATHQKIRRASAPGTMPAGFHHAGQRQPAMPAPAMAPPTSMMQQGIHLMNAPAQAVPSQPQQGAPAPAAPAHGVPPMPGAYPLYPHPYAPGFVLPHIPGVHYPAGLHFGGLGAPYGALPPHPLAVPYPMGHPMTHPMYAPPQYPLQYPAPLPPQNFNQMAAPPQAPPQAAPAYHYHLLHPAPAPVAQTAQSTSGPVLAGNTVSHLGKNFIQQLKAHENTRRKA